MASNYPGSLDSFDAIAADKKMSDAVGGRTHRAILNDMGDAIEAVQTELGANPAGGSATVKARFDVIEANDWVTAARIAADAVGSSEIAADAVGSSELADNAVDSAAIADGAVTAPKILIGAATVGSGTGTPEGVVTAAPGSTWLQIGDAVTVSGNLLWRKATGTGNTGWQPEGALADTGWRTVASWGTDGVITTSGVTLTNITAKPSTAGSILMRRAGDQVTVTIKGAVLASGATLTGMTAGFVRNAAPFMAVPAAAFGAAGAATAGSNIYYLWAHTTDNSFGSTFVVPMYGIAWPSSLPGVAA